MATVFTILAIYIMALCLDFTIALLVTVTFYRKSVPEGMVAPMTVIKPMKGMENDLEGKLRAMMNADREGALQTIYVMETEEDPAYSAASRVAKAYPDRDVEVLISGPSLKRMGKIHNMIEALKIAKHPIVVFSDSDAVVERKVLLETTRAFQSGAEAICSLPDASGRSKFTDAMIGLCFNHCFVSFATLIYRIGIACPFGGGWMAFHRDFLKRIGGLEQFSQVAADDYALAETVWRTKARAALLPVMVRVDERGGTPRELVAHLMKWMKVIRTSVWPAFALVPLASPVFLAALLVVLNAFLGLNVDWTWFLFAFTVFMRSSNAVIQDYFTAWGPFPLWAYVVLPFADIFAVFLWLCSWFSKTLVWRGKTYKIRSGKLVAQN